MPNADRRRLLVLTLGALVALTLTSFALAQLPTGGAGPVIAFAIAAAKAVLVGAVFMEIGASGTVAATAVAVAIAFIALLAAGTVTDVALR
jgi:caa(3)-type oxidase subunit IV